MYITDLTLYQLSQFIWQGLKVKKKGWEETTGLCRYCRNYSKINSSSTEIGSDE